VTSTKSAPDGASTAPRPRASSCPVGVHTGVSCCANHLVGARPEKCIGCHLEESNPQLAERFERDVAPLRVNSWGRASNDREPS
jgi:hypothetical protein